MRKLTPLFLGTILLFCLSFSLLAIASERKTVRSLMEGPPELANVLGNSSFVPLEVEKLANPAVWFVDYEWHRQHGIAVPPDGIRSPEFAREILDAYAWQSHTETDAPHEFTGEKKLLYADFYGGYGMGINFGSGRAAAAGILQAKGLKTPMAQDTDPWHSNGAVQSIEAVDEAIWSQVLESEMRYGSNKVVAVILTGTYGRMKNNNQVFPRALIIREMAIRPAHFMLNFSRNARADKKRVQETLPSLLGQLPYPKNYVHQNTSADLRAGVLELIDREAIAQAEYYAKRMYFGSVSPSNLEISGRRLDLGDHTSQEGYSAIFRIQGLEQSYFGGTAEFHELFEDFIGSLRKTLPKAATALLPKKKEMVRRFDETFKNQQRIEMVRLTGVPHEILDAHSQRSTVQKLGEILVQMAVAGNSQPQIVDPNGWENRGLFNVNQILMRLGAEKSPTLGNIEQALKQELVRGPALIPQFAKAYFNFRQEIQAQASQLGLSEVSLNTYIREASRMRNRSRPSLVRGHNRWKTLWETTDASIHQKSPVPVENYIQEQVAMNVFNFKDAAPFQVVIAQKTKSAEGLSLRKVYDAKKGEYSTIFRMDVATGEVSFRGRKFSVQELEKSGVEVRSEAGSAIAIRPTRSGNYLEFTFPQQSFLDFGKLRLISNPAAKASPGATPVRGVEVRACGKVHGF